MAKNAKAAADAPSRALTMGRFLPKSVPVFSVISNLLMLTGPLFMLQVYDRVLTSGSMPTLYALSILVILLYALYGMLEHIRSRIMARVAARVDESYQDAAFDLVGFHARSGHQEIRLTPLQDLTLLRNFIASPGPLAFLDLPWTPIYLLVIYLLHPLLGLASLLAVIIISILAIVNNARISEPSRRTLTHQAKALALGEEARKNVEAAYVLGMQTALKARWKQAQERALEHQLTASDRGSTISATSRTLRLVFQSAILGFGAYLAIQQQISPGAMIAASIIMARALAPVDQCVAHWQPFLAFREAARRMNALISARPEETDKLTLPAPTGEISVENLTVFSPENQKPIIQGVSFQISSGSGLGIIGPTGAGKSTLVRAITGIWPNRKGAIRLNGAEISQWDPEELGPFIGYLPQGVELFEGSIGDNIARFANQADDTAIVEAAQKAAAHDMIVRLDDGYNTQVGADGSRLSAGQRQRIGLARALFRNPPIVILDEPNANLDAEGEAALIRAVQAVRDYGGSVILVAHRPSAIAALDQLMMMRDGKVVAFGPKEKVLNQVVANRPVLDPDKLIASLEASRERAAGRG